MPLIKPGQVLNPKGGPRKEISAADLRTVVKYASKGVHEYTLAHLLNMDPDTFLARKKDTPKLVVAIQRGRALWHDRCVARLDKHAAKSFIPDLFTLKAKFGWSENATATDQRPVVIINLPGAATSLESYAQQQVIEAIPAGAAPLALDND